MKEGPIVVSYSVDATKNSLGLFIYDKSGNIVGGAYPDHYLDVPPGDGAATKPRDIIDYFNEKNSAKNNSYEIKLVTVVYKNVPNVH